MMRRAADALLQATIGRLRARTLAHCRVAAAARVDLLRLRNPAGGWLEVGRGSLCSAILTFERPGARIVIGIDSYIGRSHLAAAQSITVGNDVLISWDVTIVDHDSHAIDFAARAGDVAGWREGRKDWRPVRQAAVTVADKAWIGFGATVLKGVTIGEGAIVAARAVVTRDVAPWTVVAGNPARVVKELTPGG